LFSVVTQPADPDAPGVVKYAVETGGEVRATGELMPRSWFGDGTGHLLNVRWNDGFSDAGVAIAGQALADARPYADVHCGCHNEVHANVPERQEVLRAAGFELWQAKQGFVFTDEGQHLPDPEGVSFASAAQVGVERVRAVAVRCQPGTLDRMDADIAASIGDQAATDHFFDGFLDADEADTWFVITDRDGVDVGYVAVGALDEPGSGTINHIGVVHDQRGNGYVDQLLRLVNQTMRAKGWKHCVSETDTENRPMWNAFERNGHFPGVRPWQRWMYIRRAVAERQA